MKPYRVEIYAYVEVDAETPKRAEHKVKEMFDSGELTYEQLNFDAEDLTPEEGCPYCGDMDCTSDHK